MKHLFLLLSSFLLLHFLAYSQAQIYKTWVGENNEYLNIFKRAAGLQKGIEYQEFGVFKYKNRYFIFVTRDSAHMYGQKYNIVRLTQDTLILSPEGEDILNLAKPNSQNQYIFVNNRLNYKFVCLHYERPADFYDEEKVNFTLDIDSAKRSKVTVTDLFSNKTKVYRAPVTKRDYRRLINILSSYDLSCYPDENITMDSIKCSNPNSCLEIRFNDQKKIFKGCILLPGYYLKLGDFMLEYISLRSGIDFMRLGKIKR